MPGTSKSPGLFDGALWVLGYTFPLSQAVDSPQVFILIFLVSFLFVPTVIYYLRQPQSSFFACNHFPFFLSLVIIFNNHPWGKGFSYWVSLEPSQMQTALQGGSSRTPPDGSDDDRFVGKLLWQCSSSGLLCPVAGGRGRVGDQCSPWMWVVIFKAITELESGGWAQGKLKYIPAWTGREETGAFVHRRWEHKMGQSL